MSKPPPITETDEQRAVVQFLGWALAGNAVALHIRNEQPSLWERIRGARAGVLPGAPDLVVLDGGRALFIEMKPLFWRYKKLHARTVKLTKHETRQLDVHRRLRAAGCPVTICESMNEVVWWLRQQAVPLRDTDVQPTAFAISESRPAGDLLAGGA